MAEFDADSNEPQEMFQLLSQTLGDKLEVGPLNANTLSDYVWHDFSGTRKQTERKTWGELLSNLDAVEEQMQRHLNNWPEDEHIFLLEGMAIKAIIGSQVLKPSKGNKVWIKGFQYKARKMKAVYAWLYQIGKHVQIIPTAGVSESASALVAMYEGDQKETHATLHRHIKLVNFSPDPVILQYMNLLPKGIGEKTAKSLKVKFPSMKHLVFATAADLVRCEGIGSVTARNIMQGLGTTND